MSRPAILYGALGAAALVAVGASLSSSSTRTPPVGPEPQPPRRPDYDDPNYHTKPTGPPQDLPPGMGPAGPQGPPGVVLPSGPSVTPGDPPSSPSSTPAAPPNQGPPIGTGPRNLEAMRTAPADGWKGGRELLARDLAPVSSWLANPEGALEETARVNGAKWWTRDRVALQWLAAGELFVSGWSVVKLTKGNRELIVTAADTPVMLRDIRLPVSVLAGQIIADANQATLPTTAIADAIWKARSVSLTPEPLVPAYAQSTNMTSVCAWLFEEERIADQISRTFGAVMPSGIVSTTGKVYVLDPALAQNPPFCPMYGWWQKDGKPIQTVNPHAHPPNYFDYSHEVQMVKLACTYNGLPASLVDVYRDDPDLVTGGRYQVPVPSRYPLVPEAAS